MKVLPLTLPRVAIARDFLWSLTAPNRGCRSTSTRWQEQSSPRRRRKWPAWIPPIPHLPSRRKPASMSQRQRHKLMSTRCINQMFTARNWGSPLALVARVHGTARPLGLLQHHPHSPLPAAFQHPAQVFTHTEIMKRLWPLRKKNRHGEALPLASSHFNNIYRTSSVRANGEGVRYVFRSCTPLKGGLAGIFGTQSGNWQDPQENSAVPGNRQSQSICTPVGLTEHVESQKP